MGCYCGKIPPSIEVKVHLPSRESANYLETKVDESIETVCVKPNAVVEYRDQKASNRCHCSKSRNSTTSMLPMIPPACSLYMFYRCYIYLIIVNGYTPSGNYIYDADTDYSVIESEAKAAGSQMASMGGVCDFEVVWLSINITTFDPPVLVPVSPSDIENAKQLWMLPSLAFLLNAGPVAKPGNIPYFDSAVPGQTIPYFYGLQQYLETKLVPLNTNKFCCAFFVTKYPTKARMTGAVERGTATGVIYYVPGVTQSDLSYTFQHEITHCFGAADEFDECTDNSTSGTNKVINANCIYDATGQLKPPPYTPCCMNADVIEQTTFFCTYTRGQIGWPWWPITNQVLSNNDPKQPPCTLRISNNLFLFYVNSTNVLSYNVTNASTMVFAQAGIPIKVNETTISAKYSPSAFYSNDYSKVYLFYITSGDYLDFVVGTLADTSLSFTKPGLINNLYKSYTAPSAVVYTPLLGIETMYVFYVDKTSHSVFYVWSTNGIVWFNKDVKPNNIGSKLKIDVAPCAIVFNYPDAESELNLFYKDQSSNKLLHVESTDGLNWSAVKPTIPKGKEEKSENNVQTSCSPCLVPYSMYSSNSINTYVEAYYMFYQNPTTNIIRYMFFSLKYGWSIEYVTDGISVTSAGVPVSAIGMYNASDKNTTRNFSVKTNLTMFYLGQQTPSSLLYSSLTNLKQS